MIRRVQHMAQAVYYSFPVQLLLLHLKKNLPLLLCWGLLVALVSGYIGNFLGVHYLFLDPEYLNRVNFLSFFIVGIALGGFTVAFHITCYILDGEKFNFLGTLTRPFTKFSTNNAVIPILFLLFYSYKILNYQLANEYVTIWELTKRLGGLWLGYFGMIALLYTYFMLTNKDIFKILVKQVDRRLKQVNISRARAMKKWYTAKKKAIPVKYYFDYGFHVAPVVEKTYFDKEAILKVFDQNHFNSVAIELLLILLLLLLGIFKDVPAFQLPAAASGILLLTVFVMIIGAISYWFRKWAIAAAIGLLVLFNVVAQEKLFNRTYPAFGLDYQKPKVDYTLDRIRESNQPKHVQADLQNSQYVLTNWRNKFKSEKPYAFLVAVSGGGLRAALWTMTVLQEADSMTSGRFLDQTVMITGASGGLIGAGFYRELVLQAKQNQLLDPFDRRYRWQIANDNLNALLFNLLVSDAFVDLQQFQYAGHQYSKDRGYIFEKQLNINTEYLLDKPLGAYAAPEKQALIPLFLISPTIINDGRKLYISSQPMSFMATDNVDDIPTTDRGVDFLRYFESVGSQNLRFLSALRMGATFPYITPNVGLPSQPQLEIMDAGVSDNFGISDAVRFLYHFREWFAQHTRGVVLISIRDSHPDNRIETKQNKSLFDVLTNPIGNIYRNFENIQNIHNDNKMTYANSWYAGELHRINLFYEPTSLPTEADKGKAIRASLNWRLTGREKLNVMESINSPHNQRDLRELLKFCQQSHYDTTLLTNVR